MRANQLSYKSSIFCIAFSLIPHDDTSWRMKNNRNTGDVWVLKRLEMLLLHCPFSRNTPITR